MKVIAGKNKGRKLSTPDNYQIRPTGGKVKEALFSMINNRIYGAKLCDLFGGTGALGLEALSRGADFCYFGDNSKESIKLIKENIEKCNEEENTRVIFGDYKKVIDFINEELDIFIIDPPYSKGNVCEAIELICEKDLLKENGIIIIEHDKDEVFEDELFGLNKLKEKKYGKVLISIFGN